MHTTKIDTEHTQNFPATLKAATLKAHQNLERLPISSNMMLPDVTMAQYRHYLEVMYKMVYEVENRYFPKLNTVFSDLPQRCKSALLYEDLRTIDGNLATAATEIFGNNKKSLSFIAGIIYVIEGSTLGGRYILKNIESQLDFENKAATSFLAGYGPSTGSMWKKFMAELSEYEAVTQSATEIIAGAQYAFEAIYSHFEKSSCSL